MLKYQNDMVSSRVAYRKKHKNTRLLMVINILNSLNFLIALIMLDYVKILKRCGIFSFSISKKS